MTQKRFFYVLLVTVLGLFLAVTIVAAQGDTQVEKIDTGMLVLGQPFVPDGPAKDGMTVNRMKELGIVPATPAEKMGLSPTITPSKVLYKVRETFEGVWPNGLWYTYDNNGSTGGQVCWDDDNWIYFKGSWSGASANGCANGIDPWSEYYPDNMYSWMVNGPFSTVGAKNAKIGFKYWNQSELNYDFLWWCASADGSNFYCYRHSGDSHGWKSGSINLKRVPGYGSMMGDPTVWAAWVFTSDGNVVDDGGFVDNAGIVVKR